MTQRTKSPAAMWFVGPVAFLVVLGITAAIALAWAGDDAPRRQAVFFAAAVAGGGALVGWAVTWLSRGREPAVAVAGGMGATLVRLGPMLVALGWISVVDPGLKAAGAGELLVLFYLPLLAVDIGLIVLAGAGTRRNGGANAAN
jgi:hypothetical protein